MTTERRRTTPLELRLYVAAVLAAAYTVSWHAIGGHAPTAGVATPTTREPQRFVWIDTLPANMRPKIALPAGWVRASDPQPSATQPSRTVRAPSRHVPRVRTRSS